MISATNSLVMAEGEMRPGRAFNFLSENLCRRFSFSSLSLRLIELAAWGESISC